MVPQYLSDGCFRNADRQINSLDLCFRTLSTEVIHLAFVSSGYFLKDWSKFLHIGVVVSHMFPLLFFSLFKQPYAEYIPDILPDAQEAAREVKSHIQQKERALL